jgi:nucleoside-diphosphate-sugar epimerase
MSGPITLITGGAGFIGANLAHRLLLAGESVRILDNATIGQPQSRVASRTAQRQSRGSRGRRA